GEGRKGPPLRWPQMALLAALAIPSARLKTFPTFVERENTCETGRQPANLYFPMEAKAAEATQPHSVQTGLPPNWHGVTTVAMSAEMHVVTWEKIHLCGAAGGCSNPSRTRSGTSIFSNTFRRRASSSSSSRR